MIINFINQIKNGYSQKFSKIIIHNFKIIKFILLILFKFGYIQGFSIMNKTKLCVFLKTTNKTILYFKYVSKLSKRVYFTCKYLKYLMQYQKYNSFIWIISTSKGIMSHDQALLNNLGGEILYYLK